MNVKFEFKDFPTLATERLILRKGIVDDCQDILALYADENVVKYLPLTLFTATEDAIAELNWYDKIFREQTGLKVGH